MVRGEARWAIGLLAVALVMASGCGSDDTETTSGTSAGTGTGTAAGGGGPGGHGATGGTDPNCVDVDDDGSCRSQDCDDENAAVRPGQAEVCGNGLDDDCNGDSDEGCLEGTSSYFVDKDSIGGACSDSGPGTLTEPWCTIAHANATLGPGDTVYLRAGAYVNETIAPAQSGLSDEARITYSSYDDETVTLETSVYCIRLQSVSYVSILGLGFVDCERNLYLEAASHNHIGYCTFDNPSGPVTWAGSRIGSGSQYNRVYRSTFSRYGNETYYDDSYQDTGCILDIGNDNEEDASDHNLIVDSTFYYGGHHILGVYSDFNVVRHNTFHNEEWYACHRPDIGGLCGNRNVILNTSLPDGNVRNLIEDNTIVFSGVPPDQATSSGLAIRTQHNIVRRNLLYENDSSGIGLSIDGTWNDASHNHLYHNVLYHNGYLLFDDWDPEKSGIMLARWVDDANHNPMTGVAIKNNILHANQLYGIYYYYVNEAEQAVAGNWDEQGDPGFVDLEGTADPFDFTVFDFHLTAASPCVDAGAFLTTTTNAGQDATMLQVEDAGYFTDGHGLVEADMIQLEGQSSAVTITAIDYDARTITIDRSLSWEVGAGVALPYFGVAPDQGAFERAPQ